MTGAIVEISRAMAKRARLNFRPEVCARAIHPRLVQRLQFSQRERTRNVQIEVQNDNLK